MKTVHGADTEDAVDHSSPSAAGGLDKFVESHLPQDDTLKTKCEAECVEADTDNFTSLDIEEPKPTQNLNIGELQDIKKNQQSNSENVEESILPVEIKENTTQNVDVVQDSSHCGQEKITEQENNVKKEDAHIDVNITKSVENDNRITSSDCAKETSQEDSSHVQGEVAKTDYHEPKQCTEEIDSKDINEINNPTLTVQLDTTQLEEDDTNHAQPADSDTNEENFPRMARITPEESAIKPTDTTLGKQVLNELPMDKVEEPGASRSEQKCTANIEQDFSNILDINSLENGAFVANEISNTLFNTNEGHLRSNFENDGLLVNEENKIVGSNEDITLTNNCSKKSKNRPHRVSFSESNVKKIYDNEAFVPDELEITGMSENRKTDSIKKSGNGNSKDALNCQEIDIVGTYGPGEKWRILRNVFLISVGFMFLFTAFFGAANLQSSVNSKAGLGTVSLMGVYAGLIISNMFVPVMVIRWLGCKWTVALGMLTFAPYAVSQFYAEFYTMVPTALLAGIGGAPMWCAKCTYLNVAADAYAKVTGVAPELVMVRFFGLFYILFPLGHVWGNLISSEVLSAGKLEPTTNLTEDILDQCGANFCPGVDVNVNSNLQRPPDHQINTIASIFVACMIFASLLVAVGVDNLKRYNEGARADSGSGLSGMKLLAATLKLLCNRNQLLLIPITAFIGVSQAFIGADFTEGYISCSWGIRHIGYVLLGYGLASSLASVVVSWVVKMAGRLVVICSSISLFLLLVAVLKFWRPHPDEGIIFFTLAALWGMADSTALVINAMYGLLFRGNEAAAYSNFSLWGSAGFIITYSYSPHLCMNVKLAIVAVILILSLVGFIIVEFTLRRILLEQQKEGKFNKPPTDASIKQQAL